jgi:hypothetical protein
LPIEQFYVLSPTERLDYFVNQANNPQTGLAAYEKEYQLTSHDSADVLPATISINNTPSEIVTIATHEIKYAMSFDPATSERVLAGAMYDPTMGAFGAMDKFSKQYAPVPGRAAGAFSAEGHGILAGTVVGGGTVISSSPKVTQGNGETYMDIVTQPQGPNGPYKVSGRYYYINYGTSGGTWILNDAATIQ